MSRATLSTYGRESNTRFAHGRGVPLEPDGNRSLREDRLTVEHSTSKVHDRFLCEPYLVKGFCENGR